MKICLVSMEYPPETGWGGIGTYTYNQAHALANYGNEVHVIALGIDSGRDYLDGSVNVHRIKTIKVIKTKNPHFFGDCVAHSRKVFKKIKQLNLNFDVIEIPEWRAEGIVSVFQDTTPLITRLHTPLYLVNHFSEKQNTFKTRLIALNDSLVNILERNQTMYSIVLLPLLRLFEKKLPRLGILTFLA